MSEYELDRLLYMRVNLAQSLYNESVNAKATAAHAIMTECCGRASFNPELC